MTKLHTQEGVEEPEAIGEMEKYGIIRTSIDYFCYGGFRYTNLEDAIAEAKRHPRAVQRFPICLR